jgi:intracellular septation protein
MTCAPSMRKMLPVPSAAVRCERRNHAKKAIWHIKLHSRFWTAAAVFCGVKIWQFGHRAIVGTATFMAAIIIAVIVSKVKLGKISPMLKLTAALGVFFGALTIWFHDERFIQIKPTIIYAFFALLLLGGWFRGKAMLKYVLEHAYQGLDETGWLKLSLSWGIFFLVLAGLNEIFRQPEWFSFDTWLSIKVWGVTACTFLFALANIPMLMRHGLKLGDDSETPPKA